MFRPERMRLVAVTALDTHVERLTASVAKAGLLHLVDASEVPSFRDTKPRQRARDLLERTSSLETRVSDARSRLKSSGEARPEIALDRGPDDFLSEIESAVGKIEAAVDAAERTIAVSREAMARYDEASLLLELVETGDVSIEDLRGTSFSRVSLGYIEADLLGRFKEACAKFPAVHIARSVGKRRMAICAATSYQHEEALRRALNSAGFVEGQIPPGISGPVSLAREEIEEYRWEARENEADALGELDLLSREHGPALRVWAADLALLRGIEEASLNFATSGSLEIITGWIPVRELPRLREVVDRVTGNKGILTELSESDSSELALTPTSLRNPPGIRACESVVQLYGVPHYNGLDPTIIVALTFTMMFGVMFGDIGHGAVLLAAGLGAYFFFRPYSEGLASMGVVLSFCGVTSIFFGVLFGSVFGYEFHPLLFHPLDPAHPETMYYTLGLGLAIGVIMFSTGIVLNVVQQMFRRNFRQALIGEWGLANLVFYWGMIGLLFYALVNPDSPGDRLWTLGLLLLAPPVLLIAFRGPIGALLDSLRKSERSKPHQDGEHDEGVLGAAIGTAVMLLETVTGTFSHIRVAAFALNHVALSTAVYLIADLMHDLMRSSMTEWSIIIAGNLGVILLEGLIVFIQTMRLHFYEFFARFFTEMGEPYRPLKIE